ncbi:MAG: SdpI family protein [Patescibacteria group bacterium]|nr:SdpI family protein [Patescibacteria group bacterium]
MRKTEILAIFLTLASVIGAYILYPYLPEPMVSHWNAQGEPDGTMSRFWSLAMTPIVFTLFTLMLIFIPRIDPLKKNLETFRGYFDGFILILYAFFILIFGQIILWNLGTEISFNLTMPVAFAIMMFYIGVMLEKSKMNWFVGIRTPWTLSSEKVWTKTHKLAAKLFKIAAVITLIGVFFQPQAIWIMVAAILIAALYPVIYSYFAYVKENL